MGKFSGALRRRESQCKYRILLRFRVVTMSRMGNETGREAKGAGAEHTKKEADTQREDSNGRSHLKLSTEVAGCFSLQVSTQFQGIESA